MNIYKLYLDSLSMQISAPCFQKTLQNHNFGNEKINKRLDYSLERIRANPSGSFPRIFQDPYQLKAFYRLINNDHLNSTDLLQVHLQSIVRYLQDQGYSDKLYVSQDSSEIQLRTHTSKELGYVRSKTDKGFLLHSALIATSNFELLGLFWQDYIVRDLKDYGKKHKRKQRAFEDKETYKWVILAIHGQAFREQTGLNLVHVMDREADTIDVMAAFLRLGQGFIIRAWHNRALEDGTKLWDKLAQSQNEKILQREIKLDNGKTRMANCLLKYEQVDLKSKKINQPLYVVQLKEIDQEEQDPIEWILMTSEPITNFEQAIETLGGYGFRWTIEEYHKCLKTGCQLQARQQESDEATFNVTAILSIIATDMLRLRNLAREQPQAPIQQLMQEQEIEMLHALEPKTLKPKEKQQLEPGTVLWAVAILARLGGHLGIRQKGMPGWQTLWKGRNHFDILLQGYRLKRPPPN